MKPDAIHIFLAAALVLCITFISALWLEVQHERDVMRGQMDAVRLNLYDHFCSNRITRISLTSPS